MMTEIQEEDVGGKSVFGGEERVKRIKKRADAKRALQDNGFGAFKKLTGTLKAVTDEDIKKAQEAQEESVS